MWSYKKKYYKLLEEFKTLKELHENQTEYVEHLEMRVELLKRIADRFIDKGADAISDKLITDINTLPHYPKFFDADFLKQNGLLWDTPKEE